MSQNEVVKLQPDTEPAQQGWPRLITYAMNGVERFNIDCGPGKFVDYDPEVAAKIFEQIRGTQTDGEAAA